MPAIRSREVQNNMKLVLALAAVATLATAPVQAQTKWAMATPYPEGNFHTVNIKQFIQEIEQGSGGKLTIQLHANASLLPMPQIKRGVQSGQVQMGEILLSAYGNEDPFFAVDGTPFLADTWPLADKLMTLTRESIANRFASQGTRLLYMVNWPSQAFYSKNEIGKVDDLKGVRFRAYNAATARLAELMGATPVTVQQAEVPQAFATGIISAMITSAQTGVDTQAWDFAKYFYDVGGMRTRNAIFVNLRAWGALDEATRKVITEAADRAAKRGREAAEAAEKTMTARLAERGMQVRPPTPEFIAQLRAIGQKQAEEWVATAGAEGKQMIDKFRAR